jgi:hypothetical protein
MIGELEGGHTFIAHISFQAKLALITDCYFKTVVYVDKRYVLLLNQLSFRYGVSVALT